MCFIYLIYVLLVLRFLPQKTSEAGNETEITGNIYTHLNHRDMQRKKEADLQRESEGISFADDLMLCILH